MFQNNQIVGRQTKAEPEAAHNFGPVDRQCFETESRLISLSFEYVIKYNSRLGLVKYRMTEK
jgi:hypothetical protein